MLTCFLHSCGFKIPEAQTTHLLSFWWHPVKWSPLTESYLRRSAENPSSAWQACAIWAALSAAHPWCVTPSSNRAVSWALLSWKECNLSPCNHQMDWLTPAPYTDSPCPLPSRPWTPCFERLGPALPVALFWARNPYLWWELRLRHLVLRFLGKIAVRERSGHTPGSPRHPSIRSQRPTIWTCLSLPVWDPHPPNPPKLPNRVSARYVRKSGFKCTGWVVTIWNLLSHF